MIKKIQVSGEWDKLIRVQHFKYISEQKGLILILLIKTYFINKFLMSVGFGNNYEPKLNFKEIFSDPQLSVYDLLASEEIVKQVKASIKIFTKELIKKQFLIKDLIDITIRPEFVKQNGKDIPIVYPFLAIEILCSQQDQFYSYLFRHGFHRTLSFPKMNQESEHTKAPVMYIFEILQTNNRLNDTAAGYLARLIQQITVYQKGTELFELLKKNEKIYGLLFQHSYCTSIMEIFKHLLFIENQEILEKKEQLIERLFSSLLEEKRSKELIQKLDNIVAVVQELIEKYNEKSQYQRKKFFFVLLKYIICNKNVCSIKLMIQKFKDNQDIVSSGLDILLKFLKYEKLEKKKEEQRNKNLKIVVEKNYSEFQILQQFQKVVEFLLANLYLNISLQSPCKTPLNTNNNKIKISTMKLFFLIQQILNLNQRFSNVFISTRFIKLNVKLFRQFPFNNFLHNSQKEIIILSLQTERAIDICYKQAGLIDFIIQSFTNPDNKKIGYMNQLYHIVNAIELIRSKRSTINLILTQYPLWYEILTNNYSKMKSQYQKFLGGENPKAEQELIKLNWQNLNNDNLQNGQDTPAFVPNHNVHITNKNDTSDKQNNKPVDKMQDLDFSALKDDYDQYQNDYGNQQEQEVYSPGDRNQHKKSQESNKKQTEFFFSQPVVENINHIQMKGLQFDQYQQQQEIQDIDADCYIQDEPMSVGRNRSSRW